MLALLHSIQVAAPNLEAKSIRAFLAALDERYTRQFVPEKIALHISLLQDLSREKPVRLHMETLAQGHFGITVLGFNHPGAFSVIAGILSAMGYNILSGSIFTTRPQDDSASRSRIKTLRPEQRRKIIDSFEGELHSALPLSLWQGEALALLHDCFAALELGGVEKYTQVKRTVNELVADRLQELSLPQARFLFPMEITLHNPPGLTSRLAIISEDTPFFLYALSTALTLRQIDIESIRIQTRDNRIEDEFEILGPDKQPITQPKMQDAIKLTVLLTKQFTYFLGGAPDPFAALNRFEQMLGDLMQQAQRPEWLETLADPRVMHELAKLLGASDYLWEDMIRRQYETLLPILRGGEQRLYAQTSRESLAAELKHSLKTADSLAEQKARLNAFKDRQLFLIDLDHMFNPEANFQSLAAHLARLAEIILAESFRILLEDFESRFGQPLTIAGLPSAHAVFGLGKLGGQDLGYASDIEVMVLYQDSGETSGPEKISNSEFYSNLTRELPRFIQAKREGIFTIDLRLRPYGQDGPMAASLEKFIHYYGPHGAAHAVERMALVRLRFLFGDPDLGSRVERLRDEFIYQQRNFDFQSFNDLRKKQFIEKVGARGINAKFSPGGLVDLEYDTQLLQIMAGHTHPECRTPNMIEALQALKATGVLSGEEHSQLGAAYAFFRNLINGLRILRGTAVDLFLPELDTLEYTHLARRLGYERRENLTPSRQLHADFETHTAVVRAFIERHFGRDTLPGKDEGNIVDLLLSPGIEESLKAKIFTRLGFSDYRTAFLNIRKIAGRLLQPTRFAPMLVLAMDVLGNKPAPDLALNHWENFLAALDDPETHLSDLMAQPRRLDLMMNIFSSGNFLSHTLIANPGLWSWLTHPALIQRSFNRADYERYFLEDAGPAVGEGTWLDSLRSFRRKQILRIGTRDLCLKKPLEEITGELSALAEAIVNQALGRAWQEEAETQACGREELEKRQAGFALFALGKLGGGELNYSSDIDLLMTVDDSAAEAFGLEIYKKVLTRFRRILEGYTASGQAYRVDFRLRPYGIDGDLIPKAAAVLAYYSEKATLIEKQSLLKLRCIAGQMDFGARLTQQIKDLLAEPRSSSEVFDAIEKIRRLHLQRAGKGFWDVKEGRGGIRDIEFTVQGYQMVFGSTYPQLLHGNTLRALSDLAALQIVALEKARVLETHYRFLRQAEHLLQIFDDQQIHAIPEDPDEQLHLAQHLFSIHISRDQFQTQLRRMAQEVTALTADLIQACRENDGSISSTHGLSFK